jgi:hypothetical protein
MFNTPRPSNSQNKKFEVDVKIGDKTKKILFGAKGYSHYTEGHLDEKRKQNYIQRHKTNEDWNNPFTAGFWSYHYLWRFKTYKEAKEWILRNYFTG